MRKQNRGRARHEEKEADQRRRGGRSVKRGGRGTGWQRSRRARSVQVVAGISDQYFHRFSGGYRQVVSSRSLSNPYPSLVYSDDAISLLPPFPRSTAPCPLPLSSFVLRLLLSSSLIFLSFLFLFTPFPPTFFIPLFHSSHFSVSSTRSSSSYVLLFISFEYLYLLKYMSEIYIILSFNFNPV